MVPTIDTLQSEIVTISRYRMPDIPQLFAAAKESVNQVYPWLAWCHPNYAMPDAQAWVTRQVQAWNEGQEFAFVIRSPSGEFLGAIGLNQLDQEHRIANLGYWLRAGRTGFGYATNATRLLIGFGLRELGLRRIEIVAAVGNRASQRVAERAGAVREGILRNRLLLHGQSHDAVVYSIVPGDVENRGSTP